MWRVSYIEDDVVKIKSGFKSDKEADEWVCSKEKEKDFVPLKLLVWSELLQCYKVVEEYNKSEDETNNLAEKTIRADERRRVVNEFVTMLKSKTSMENKLIDELAKQLMEEIK